MESRLNESEKEELRLQRFVNKYKDKSMGEIVYMTLELKQSEMYSYEITLLDIIRSGISEKLSVGMLVSRQIVLERLIENNSPEKEILNEYLQKVLTLLRR